MIMGIYSREEVLDMDIDEPAAPREIPGSVTVEPVGLTAEDLAPISQDQRQSILRTLKNNFPNDAHEVLRTLLSEFNLQSTEGMPMHIYRKFLGRIKELTSGGNANG